MIAGLDDGQESFFVPACAPQADSTKESGPVWTLPRGSREGAQKFYAGEKFKVDVVGRCSPGPVYEPNPVKQAPKWVFGTEPRGQPPKASFPETSNDLLGKTPKLTAVYRAPTKVVMGSASRDAQVLTPDLDTFMPGGESPGPQRYMPPIPRDTRAFSLKFRTKMFGVNGDTPARVGPGTYPVPDFPAEHKSEKRSPTEWSVYKTDRWKQPMKAHERYLDRLEEGHKREQYHRQYNAAPSYSFGSSSRNSEQKRGLFQIPEDKGPAAKPFMPSASCPALPVTIGPGGKRRD